MIVVDNVKNKIKQIIYILTTILFVLAYCYSILIYTSLMSPKLPWYEPDGIQFIALLIISFPSMIIISIANIFLGKFMELSKQATGIPFLVAIIIGLLFYIGVFRKSFGLGMQIVGTLSCVVGIIASIYFCVKDIKRVN